MTNSFSINFLIYKSDRSNAKCELYTLFHFDDTTTENDLRKIIHALDSIVHTSYGLRHTKEGGFIVRPSIHASIAADNPRFESGDIYTDDTRVYIPVERTHFNSIESLTKGIYDVYMMCNRSSLLTWKEVRNNPSIQYYWNEYHDGPVIRFGPSNNPESGVTK